VELLANPDVWIALLTLTTLEIVLGIDNVVFISILAGKLPAEQRDKARKLGLGLAMITRILLLLSINWIAHLEDGLFSIAGHAFSGRDLIMLGGGLFLIAKATTEIHARLEGEEHGQAAGPVTSFASIIVQIIILDIVFSLDSVITAVGMADDIEVMVAAVVIAVGVMLVASGPIADFVHHHPTVKMLALAFLVMIGFSLMAEGWHLHIPKAYIYAAMAFSIMVELLNIQASKRKKRSAPVQLRAGVGDPS
jgi:predicted tellurium resistance membrane protein TerC